MSSTRHTVETVRDWFFLVLGIFITGVGFWNMAFGTQTYYIGNVKVLAGSGLALVGVGLIIALTAVALLLRLKRRTVIIPNRGARIVGRAP